MKKESNSTPIIIAIIAVCCIVLPIIILGVRLYQHTILWLTCKKM